MRSEPTMSADRDPVLPLGGIQCVNDVYRQAGITDPRNQIDCVVLNTRLVDVSHLREVEIACREHDVEFLKLDVHIKPFSAVS